MGLANWKITEYFQKIQFYIKYQQLEIMHLAWWSEQFCSLHWFCNVVRRFGTFSGMPEAGKRSTYHPYWRTHFNLRAEFHIKLSQENIKELYSSLKCHVWILAIQYLHTLVWYFYSL